MKVIFLDIDGVLNVYSQGRDEFGSISKEAETKIKNQNPKLKKNGDWKNEKSK